RADRGGLALDAVERGGAVPVRRRENREGGVAAQAADPEVVERGGLAVEAARDGDRSVSHDRPGPCRIRKEEDRPALLRAAGVAAGLGHTHLPNPDCLEPEKTVARVPGRWRKGFRPRRGPAAGLPVE